MLQNRCLLPAFAAIVVASAGAEHAAAQLYPSHPITLAMPFAAGGPGDTLARILADGMRRSLGQPVIVENVTGASGSIGAGRVARAQNDGYSLILGNWTTHVVNAVTYPLPYDVVRDFEPVSLVASQPVIIISGRTLPAENLSELIAWLKANPKASAGNAGIGTASHLAALFFRKETGTQFQLVPYRGGAPATQDLLSGQIDLMFDLAANALPQARAGSIRTYAVMAADRIGAAPDIPTVDEAGLPGLYLSLWNGVWAPKDTPKPIIERLDAAIRESLSDPEIRRHLIEIGHEIPPADQQTPDALRAYQKTEIEKWWPIIAAAGIRGE